MSFLRPTRRGGPNGAAVVARSSQNPLHLPRKGWTGHAFTLAAHTGRVWGRPGRGVGSTAEGIDRSVSGRARGPCVSVGWVPAAPAAPGCQALLSAFGADSRSAFPLLVYAFPLSGFLPMGCPGPGRPQVLHQEPRVLRASNPHSLL